MVGSDGFNLEMGCIGFLPGLTPALGIVGIVGGFPFT
jgi:hypothetical protein